MQTFCTIITANYYPKALTLFRSLEQFDPNIRLQVLIADNKAVPDNVTIPENVSIIKANELAGYSLVNDLHTKYAHHNMDAFRWSLKPVLMSWLLEQGFEKVLYIDCDMFIVNPYDFLFDKLDQSAILLTPNWINSDPLKDKDSFFSLFTSGLFSAGFIGANKKGSAALQWWAHACHFMMGEHIQHGIRDDQKYLDVFPVKFEDTYIIRHRGCNIGAWNIDESRRTLVNGEVLINEEFPVIFIHFDDMMVKSILKGHDRLLTPYYDQYKRVFEESGARLADYIRSADTHANPGMIPRLKWKLNIRTRLKQFFYKLSNKI
ncbi:MAG: hypothetical protein JNK14_13335 [Chitinophagaceae bacterium]|nr:hypothetical protein [Chitinophagaceae bacterium]